MLKKAPKKGHERETFSRSTKIINPTALEIAAFVEVKAALCDVVERCMCMRYIVMMLV
jgi:hypothetical protein